MWTYMKTENWLSFIVKAIGALIVFGICTSANSAPLEGDSWKEQALLHDGQRLIVQRSQTYGGRREIGQPLPVKVHTFKFVLPGTSNQISWTSEYAEELGRTDFTLLAVHILNNTPYLIVTPNLCLSYNKWGRPNPPYVVFKYDSQKWQRIPLEEMPAEFNNVNLVVDVTRIDHIKESSEKTAYVPAESISEINSGLGQQYLKEILRKPLPKEKMNLICEGRVLYKGSWILPNDPVARRFIDSQNK
jgi:hypothetical protein